MNEEIKYKFLGYYKYRFLVEDEEGNQYENVDQNSGDIYRLEINPEGKMRKSSTGNQYYIDGVEFARIV